jgi:hypothetical protein
MTTQATPIPVPRAVANLTDAIRAEVREEIAEQLRTWWASARDTYLETGDADGAIDDAITTLLTA